MLRSRLKAWRNTGSRRHPAAPDSAGAGQGLRMCICNELLVMLMLQPHGRPWAVDKVMSACVSGSFCPHSLARPMWSCFSPGPTHLSSLLTPDCSPSNQSTPHSPPGFLAVRTASLLEMFLPSLHCLVSISPSRLRRRASSSLKPFWLFLSAPVPSLPHALLPTQTASWCSLGSEQ